MNQKENCFSTIIRAFIQKHEQILLGETYPGYRCNAFISTVTLHLLRATTYFSL